MKLREAAQRALEVLEEIHPGNMTPLAEGAWNTAITALRAALAEDAMQRKPLSIETINKLWNDAVGWGDASSNEVTFVRAIERAHGIGEEE